MHGDLSEAAGVKEPTGAGERVALVGGDASAEEQLEALKGAVVRHLDRFAFREAPLGYDWK